MSTRYFTNSYCRRDQEQYAVKLKMPKGSLAPLKKCNLNVNLYNLAEVRALSKKFGKVAPLSLTKMYFAMSAAEGARIDEDALCDILDTDGIKKHEEFISYCLDKSLIKLFREISPGESVENPIIPGNETRLPDIDSDSVSEFSLIEELDIPEIRFELLAFAAKIIRDSNGKSRLHQQTLDNWQSEYRTRPLEFLDALKFSNSLTKCVNLKVRAVEEPRQGRKKGMSARELHDQLVRGVTL